MAEPPEPEYIPDWMKEGQEANAEAEADAGAQEEATKEKKKKSRKRRSKSGTSLHDLEGGSGSEDEEDGVSAEALTGSVREPPPPWKLSIFTALTGLVLVVILMILPSMRGVVIDGSYYPTPYFIFIIVAVATLWSFYGVAKEEYLANRLRSLIGLGIAVLTTILIFVAVATDPYLDAAKDSEQEQDTRQQMTPEELRQWRQERLNRFQQ
jgi:hypothetical protein